MRNKVANFPGVIHAHFQNGDDAASSGSRRIQRQANVIIEIADGFSDLQYRRQAARR